MKIIGGGADNLIWGRGDPAGKGGGKEKLDKGGRGESWGKKTSDEIRKTLAKRGLEKSFEMTGRQTRLKTFFTKGVVANAKVGGVGDD